MKTFKKLVKNIFQFEARMVLKKYKPKIIAVTGSVGKTTTRDFLYSVLSKKFFVRKSEKSFTTELGIPLTIIGRPAADIALPFGSGLRDFVPFFRLIYRYLFIFFFGLKILIWKSSYPQYLILEIDGDKQGDIQSVSDWLYINILVVTAIGETPSHIEAFDSDLPKFLAEKKNLINSVNRDGIIFYNGDDETACRLVAETDLKKISCGAGGDCSVRSEQFSILSGTVGGMQTPIGMTFELPGAERPDAEIAGNPESSFCNTSSSSLYPEKYPVTIMDSVGVHNQYASLLSFAVAKELGVAPSEIISSIEKSNLLPGRMKIISGVKNTTIIDDSYNSSPIAMKEALETFARIISSSGKIAVMGDMLELGKFSAEEHKKLAQKIKETASYVICVGIRARRIDEELLDLGFPELSVICLDTSIEAGKFLQDILKEGDIVLVKGSQAMRMERVVEEVMRHPEDKETLLVRQEPEWLERK